MCMRCLEMSRRSLLIGGGVAAAALTTGVAEARIRPADMVPLVGPGFKPTDRDEIGLWHDMDRVEEEVSSSNLLIEDPKITGFFSLKNSGMVFAAPRDCQFTKCASLAFLVSATFDAGGNLFK